MGSDTHIDVGLQASYLGNARIASEHPHAQYLKAGDGRCLKCCPLTCMQGVQAAAGCAIAQTPAGHHGPGGGASGGGLGAYNYEAMSSMAKSAAKLSGKQLRTFGEAGFRYLAAQYDTWRGGAQPGPDGLTLPGALPLLHAPCASSIAMHMAAMSSGLMHVGCCCASLRSPHVRLLYLV